MGDGNTGVDADISMNAMERARAMTVKLTNYHDGLAKEAARVLVSEHLMDTDGVQEILDNTGRSGRMIPALKTLAATGSLSAAYLVAYMNEETTFKVKAGSTIKEKTITGDRLIDHLIMEPLSRGDDVSRLLPTDREWPMHPDENVFNDTRAYRTLPGSSMQDNGNWIWAEEVFENLLKRSRTPEDDLKTMGFDAMGLLALVIRCIPNNLLGADTRNGIYHAVVGEMRGKGTDHILHAMVSLAETLHAGDEDAADRIYDTVITMDDITENAELPVGFIVESIRSRENTSRVRYLDDALNAEQYVAKGMYGSQAKGYVWSIDSMLGWSKNLETMRERAQEGQWYRLPPITRGMIAQGETVSRLIMSMPQSIYQLMNIRQLGDTGYRSIPTGFHLIRPLDDKFLTMEFGSTAAAYYPKHRTKAEYGREMAWAEELLGCGADAAYRWMVWTVIQRLIEYMNPTGIATAVPERQARAWVLEGVPPVIMIKPLVTKKPAKWGEDDGKSAQTVSLTEDMARDYRRREHPERITVNVAGMFEDLPRTWDGFQAVMQKGETGEPFRTLRRILGGHISCTTGSRPHRFPIPSEKAALDVDKLERDLPRFL